MIESNEPAARPKSRARSKTIRYRKVADLVRDAYASKRKHLRVTRADRETMLSAQGLTLDERQELLSAASSDRTLERTRELLLLTSDALANCFLAEQVRNFTYAVLGKHPAYQLPQLRGVLEDLPGAPTIDEALSVLNEQSLSQLEWPQDVPPLKKSEVRALRLAAVHCLLIWMRETRGISVDRIQGFLYTACWSQPEGKLVSDGKALRELILARDFLALKIACFRLEDSLKKKIVEADAARESADRAQGIANQLRSELSERMAQLRAERLENESLLQKIERRKADHEDEKVHLRNEYEELRGKTLRSLRQEVSLLEEGLHALRRSPPKVHVMDDHAERAIDGLRKEISRIQGEDV